MLSVSPIQRMTIRLIAILASDSRTRITAEGVSSRRPLSRLSLNACISLKGPQLRLLNRNLCACKCFSWMSGFINDLSLNGHFLQKTVPPNISGITPYVHSESGTLLAYITNVWPLLYLTFLVRRLDATSSGGHAASSTISWQRS